MARELPQADLIPQIADALRPNPADSDTGRTRRARAATAFAKVVPMASVPLLATTAAEARFAKDVAARVDAICAAYDAGGWRGGLVPAADAKLIAAVLHPDAGGDVALFRAFQDMRPKLDQGEIERKRRADAEREAAEKEARRQKRQAAKARREVASGAGAPP